MSDNLTNENLKYLANVPSNNYFILSNGKSVANLEELYSAVMDSDPAVFYNHVNDDRNDFVNWIKYCVQYIPLCDKLSGITQKEVFLGVLAEEITILKNPKIAETVKYFSDNPDLQSNPHPLTDDPSVQARQKLQEPPIIQVAVEQSPIGQSVMQPISQSTIQPAIQVIVQPVIHSDSQSSPLQSSTPQNLPPVQVATPIRQQTLVQQQDALNPNNANLTDQIKDEVFEFENILKGIIEDIEKDISAWES